MTSRSFLSELIAVAAWLVVTDYRQQEIREVGGAQMKLRTHLSTQQGITHLPRWRDTFLMHTAMIDHLFSYTLLMHH